MSGSEDDTKRGNPHRRALTPEARSAAEARYSGMLAEAFEAVAGPTLVQEHPDWSSLLMKSVLMPRVDKLDMDVSAIAVPRLGGGGRVLHAFEWDELDRTEPAELADDLLRRVRDALLKGE